MCRKPLICTQCGAPLHDGQNKCEYCGTTFVSAAEVQLSTRISQLHNILRQLRHLEDLWGKAAISKDEYTTRRRTFFEQLQDIVDDELCEHKTQMAQSEMTPSEIIDSIVNRIVGTGADMRGDDDAEI